MAVTLNNAGGAWGDGANTTLTGSVTVASGTGRALIAFTNDACTGVTYGGVSLTLPTTSYTGASGITPAWAINTNSGGPYDNNGTWSKFQRVPITPSLSVYSHVGTITQTMQAWRPF